MARTQRFAYVFAVVAVAAALVFAIVPVDARTTSQDKQIVVTVMNLTTGQPVSGVTSGALALREDGNARDIVKVDAATSPVSVALLADTTYAFNRYVKELRTATQAFVSALFAKQTGASASLWTFAGAAVPVTPFVTSPEKLTEEAGKLRPVEIVQNVQSAAESNLLEGVLDAAKALGKRPETRRVIVSFNASTALERSRVTPQQVQTELQKAGASWFAVTFNDGGASSPLRDTVMTQVLPYSGGLRLTINDVTRLEPAMKALADMLAVQYVVSYSRASGSPKEVQIEVKGDGLRAFYPRWAPK